VIFATILARPGDLDPLPERQRFVAFVIAAGLVVLIFELVRRRKLREEYSWVWVITAIGLAVLAWHQELLLTLSQWVGSSNAVSTLFFGALLFLLALVLQYSVRLSRLTHRYRTLGQRLALLEEEMHRMRNERAREQEQQPQRLPGDRDEVA
jgi:ABC-type polysaccharide/polyol phosphate export permease